MAFINKSNTMQETIKVIKEALNKNANELYDFNQKKNEIIRDLVSIQIEIYQRDERQAKLQQELNQLRGLSTERGDSESLKGADMRRSDLAQQSPIYNDNCEKQKAN